MVKLDQEKLRIRDKAKKFYTAFCELDEDFNLWGKALLFAHTDLENNDLIKMFASCYDITENARNQVYQVWSGPNSFYPVKKKSKTKEDALETLLIHLDNKGRYRDWWSVLLEFELPKEERNLERRLPPAEWNYEFFYRRALKDKVGGDWSTVEFQADMDYFFELIFSVFAFNEVLATQVKSLVEGVDRWLGRLIKGKKRFNVQEEIEKWKSLNFSKKAERVLSQGCYKYWAYHELCEINPTKETTIYLFKMFSDYSGPNMKIRRRYQIGNSWKEFVEYRAYRKKTKTK